MRRITALTSELLWSVLRGYAVDQDLQSAPCQANRFIGPHLLEGACRRVTCTRWCMTQTSCKSSSKWVVLARSSEGSLAEARADDVSSSGSAFSQPDTPPLGKGPRHRLRAIHGLLTLLDPSLTLTRTQCPAI